MDQIRQAFGDDDVDLYDILKISRDDAEDPAKLRKAYFRQALVYHPDKQNQASAGSSDAAKAKFQAISLAYQVLKHPEKRAEYNETGHVDERDDDDDENKNKSQKDWKEYFDRIFGKVTTSKIDQFAVKYKCSEEEQRDVLKEYQRWKGDLVKMLEYVMLSEPLDAKRWVEDYIQPALQKKTIPNYQEALDKSMKKLEKKIEKEQKKAQAKRKKPATNTESATASKKENKKPEADNEDEDDDEDDDDDYDANDEDISEEEGDDESATETEDDDDDDEEIVAEPVAIKRNKNAATAKKVSATKAKPTKAKAKPPQKKKAAPKKSKDDDLIAMIQNNQAQRSTGSLFASIGARYGVTMDNDDDENGDDGDPLGDDEFDKISARLQKNKKKRAR